MIYRYRPRYRPTLGPRGRFGLGNDIVNGVTSAVMTPTSSSVPNPVTIDTGADLYSPPPSRPLYGAVSQVNDGIAAIGSKIAGAIDTLFGGSAASAPAASTGLTSTAKLALGAVACGALYVLTKKKRR